MGWAKYYEDNIRICDDRHYDQSNRALSTVHSDVWHALTMLPLKNTQQPVKRHNCPVCKLGFETDTQLSTHITSTHSNSPAFFLVNGVTLIEEEENRFEAIRSIQILNYGTSTVHGKVIFDESTIASAWLDRHNRIIDLTNTIGKYIANRLTFVLEVDEISTTFAVFQHLNILDVTLDQIRNRSYRPEYFYYDVANRQFSLKEYRVFLSMLAHNGDSENAEMLREIIRVDPAMDESETIIDYFLYDSLYCGKWAEKEISENCSVSVTHAFCALYHLMNLDFARAENDLKAAGQNRTDFQNGCQLLLAYIKDDAASIQYFEKEYSGSGILLDINTVVKEFRTVSYNGYSAAFESARYALQPLSQFKLLKAINSLAAAIVDGVPLNAALMDSSFSRISPICSVIRAEQQDAVGKEKILFSAVKRFKNCEWLAEYVATSHNYGWVNQRITPGMSKLYRQQVEKANKHLSVPLGENFIRDIDLCSDLAVVSLGKQELIGGSCYVISSYGYKIMFDCGVAPGIQGETALPDFDLFEGTIDAIIITHAHADHSGAIARAHARWPSAPIFTSPETKAMLEPLLVDMAVSNQAEFESENNSIPIDKIVAYETYTSIVTAKFAEWICISDSARFRLLCAGHLLGAAMVELRLGSKTVIYTGDFCFHSQELVSGARVSDLPAKPDLLICEATYIYSDSERNWHEQCLSLRNAIKRECKIGNVILLPATAMGRAQELLCIVGDMIQDGSLNKDTQIFIGGFAIKTCAALLDILNNRYRQLLERTIQLNDESVPPPSSIIIASSGSMRKGSASFRIAQAMLQRTSLGVRIMTSGAIMFNDASLKLDRKTESHPLSTHADKKEIESLIAHLSPKALALVHWGTSSVEEKSRIMKDCRNQAHGDLLTLDLSDGKQVKVFDIKSWIEKESAHYDKI